MINRLMAALLLLLLLSIPAMSQSQGSVMVGNEKNYKKLQALRVWMIIDELDIDSSSEKGVALLEAIKKYSDGKRDLLIKNHTNIHKLWRTCKDGEITDEEEAARIIQEIEETNKQLRALSVEEEEELAKILTPLERAKLFLAEESFRRQIRSAMGRHGKGRPRGQGRDEPKF